MSYVALQSIAWYERFPRHVGFTLNCGRIVARNETTLRANERHRARRHSPSQSLPLRSAQAQLRFCRVSPHRCHLQYLRSFALGAIHDLAWRARGQNRPNQGELAGS
jgi:hypothetical protein